MMTPRFANIPEAYAQIMQAALDAVEPRRAVLNALNSRLWETARAQGLRDPETAGRVLVLGAGKAAAPMAQGVVDSLRAGIRLSGLVVTKHGHGLQESDGALPGVRVVEATHPLPDAAGLAAGEEILRIAESATEDDLVIALISGGGSALLEALAPPITLEDWQRTTSLLLASGATITEINTLRKRLSRIKGGQLARAVAPASLITLVLSDVVGSPLDAIASGPTVPDKSSWRDAWQVVEKYQLQTRLPESVRTRLQAGVVRQLPENPGEGDPVFARALTRIVGDNQIATSAAAAMAQSLGYHVEVRTNALEGEAAEVARTLVAEAIAYRERALLSGASLPACLMWGGETTVTLGDGHGRGGRNQEMALAAALALEGQQGIHLIALATDGTDGPTDAAGGWASGETVDRARGKDVDLARALARHDAYSALQRIGALLETGPTRTNVNDIAFVFIEPNKE